MNTTATSSLNSLSARAIAPDIDPMQINNPAFIPVDPAFWTQPMDGLTLFSMALMLVGVMGFFWGIQLYTGILFPRRQQTLLSITPQAKAFYKQLQEEKKQEWEAAKKDPQMRTIMKSNAITYLGISMCSFGLLYALNSTDPEPLRQELTESSLIWDDYTYFQQQQWVLHSNKTVSDAKGIVLGTWNVRSDSGFSITLKDPSVRKINGLSGRPSDFDRTLLFKLNPSTGKWHSFDVQMSHNGPQKRYDRYEVARVIIKSTSKASPVRPTFSSGFKNS